MIVKQKLDFLEPIITINGVQLTEGQAMTLRVAAGGFAMELQQNGLGDDEHGKAMTAGYFARLNEIFELMERRSYEFEKSVPNATKESK